MSKIEDEGSRIEAIAVLDAVEVSIVGFREMFREVAAGVPLLHGHHDALSRAVGNVLLNAVEASGERGNLALRVALLGLDGRREVVVAVRDSGTGIPPERLAAIWEPYVTHKAGGTGLGLAIVRQTVLAHGGRVEAESAPGSGTEIRLIFPAGDRQNVEEQ